MRRFWGRSLLATSLALILAQLLVKLSMPWVVPRAWVSEEFRRQVEFANTVDEIGNDPWGAPWIDYSVARSKFPDQVWSAGPDGEFTRSGDDVLLLYTPALVVVPPQGPRRMEVRPISDEQWWLALVYPVGVLLPVRLGLSVFIMWAVLYPFRNRLLVPRRDFRLSGVLASITACLPASAIVISAQEVDELVRYAGVSLPAWPTPLAVFVGAPVWAVTAGWVAFGGTRPRDPPHVCGGGGSACPTSTRNPGRVASEENPTSRGGWNRTRVQATRSSTTAPSRRFFDNHSRCSE